MEIFAKLQLGLPATNANGFYLCAIASPVNSAQFVNSCAKFRATEFRLETLISSKDEMPDLQRYP